MHEKLKKLAFIIRSSNKIWIKIYIFFKNTVKPDYFNTYAFRKLAGEVHLRKFVICTNCRIMCKAFYTISLDQVKLH